MAFVFQSPTLLTWRTVAGNVRLPLELDGIRGREREERVQHVLDLVGLTEFSRAFPGELSGGMQMRVSLARALVTQPQLLLLDEPFGALDEITRQRLNEELVGLWQRDAWTGVFVTHNVVEAVFLSTRVLVMSRRPGTLVADIPVTLPYPREPGLRTSDEFNGLVASVGEALWSHG
jgi:NitT/TauT family transport system ATP-binding protein